MEEGFILDGDGLVVNLLTEVTKVKIIEAFHIKHYDFI